jgi:hypothetical protein
MISIGLLLIRMLRDYFKSRPQLEAEIVILRHQLNLIQRRAPHLRFALPNSRIMLHQPSGGFQGSFPPARKYLNFTSPNEKLSLLLEPPTHPNPIMSKMTCSPPGAHLTDGQKTAERLPM